MWRSLGESSGNCSVRKNELLQRPHFLGLFENGDVLFLGQLTDVIRQVLFARTRECDTPFEGDRFETTVHVDAVQAFRLARRIDNDNIGMYGKGTEDTLLDVVARTEGHPEVLA